MLMLRFIASLRDNKNELSEGSSSYSWIAGGNERRGSTWHVQNRQPERGGGGGGGGERTRTVVVKVTVASER